MVKSNDTLHERTGPAAGRNPAHARKWRVAREEGAPRQRATAVSTAGGYSRDRPRHFLRVIGSPPSGATRSLIMMCLFVCIISSCGRGMTDKPAMEFMPNMADSPSVKAQEAAMRQPVEETRPIGFKPYPFGLEEGDVAGLALNNPLDVDKKTLLAGQKSYNNYCIVCHGRTGKGNGSIVPKFPMPPSLHSEKVRGWSDGRIYHVITRGQNLMPAYTSQIPEAERWAVIHYLRALQRSVNPTDEDLQLYNRALSRRGKP